LAPFPLPPAPAAQAGPVKAWSQPVVIPTYLPLPADKNPMFLEKRVYQGSSGCVYPLAFTDRIATEKTDKTWQALHLENPFVRLMVLPEIGGRIHVGLDKTNGYDFFYRQNVIKPALVGLAGSWISGGVEFNWPQHHRPATFMPVATQIEEHADGSRTIWCSDHDPLQRLKGMHGVCLHPDKAYVELKVRLFNRTPFTQTFLWWANVATRVHEHYQSFFPPDVHYVADHAKRAMSRYPLCAGHYYGVDYGARGRHGVPPNQTPRQFVPPGTYAANDLSWYANIPVPTSYMAMGSREDFFGGYDHAAQAGVVHVANHHIAPGKKQWTWGNHEFGYAWDRNLTDTDGPYIEIMAGVYTDNQPDFSFLAPGETRTFSQYWYPIQKIGPAQKANRDAAVSLHLNGCQAAIGVAVSGRFSQARVRLECRGQEVAHWTADLAPDAPLLVQADIPAKARETDLTLILQTAGGQELLRYAPAVRRQSPVPPPATEPALPRDMKSNDELYLTGRHLAQYRHATRHPETYWREALRRDPGDVRCNNALGVWHLQRGEFTAAETFFRTAVATQTRRNPNPDDGEPHYNLGVALRYLGRTDDAYAAFYKATWNFPWRAPAYHALAQLDAQRGCWSTAAEHLNLALRVNADNLQARNLAVIAWRQLGDNAAAERLLAETLALDPLDPWACALAGRPIPGDNQVRLDIAWDLAQAGLWAQAEAILQAADFAATDGTTPLLGYARGYLLTRQGDHAGAAKAYAAAAQATPDYCFPNRLEDMVILQAALHANPRDARAHYYLGNLYYDRRRHDEAMTHWQRSARLDGSFAIVWRNLGIGYFNVGHDAAQARRAFDKARAANPADARIFYERDQLWKRIGETPARRLAELEKYPALVQLRDDLTVELSALYNQTGHHAQAQALLAPRKFQPWEGGEGLALGQHVRTHLALGRQALAAGDALKARELFQAALDSPPNLGEAKHLLANQSDIHYYLGLACAAAGDARSARQWWTKAAAARGDFQEMSVKSFSEMTYYNALALAKLNQNTAAKKLLRDLLSYGRQLMHASAKVDYFATSLPAMLLFNDDLQKRNTITARFLQAQALLGLGRVAPAQNLLRQVLRADRNHALAADLLATLNK